MPINRPTLDPKRILLWIMSIISTPIWGQKWFMGKQGEKKGWWGFLFNITVRKDGDGIWKSVNIRPVKSWASKTSPLGETKKRQISGRAGVERLLDHPKFPGHDPDGRGQSTSSYEGRASVVALGPWGGQGKPETVIFWECLEFRAFLNFCLFSVIMINLYLRNRQFILEIMLSNFQTLRFSCILNAFHPFSTHTRAHTHIKCTVQVDCWQIVVLSLEICF